MGVNFEFLTKFQKLENQVTYDWVKKLPFASVCYAQSNPSPFQNYALIKDLPNHIQMAKLEEMFKSLERAPTAYFESGMDTKLIENLGYKKTWEDSWMFYKEKEIDKSRFNQVKVVSDEKELRVFLETFDGSYQKGDPQNPYGEVKDYSINARLAWLKFGKTNRLQYFVAFQEDEPVATSILNSFGGVGYISGVGSLRKVRGRGFGKLATLYAVSKSQELGNLDHCLATEEGTYPNEFYKRIGFETRFTAVGYCKN